MIELSAEHLLRLRELGTKNIGTTPVTSLPGGVVVRPRGRGLETADIRVFEPGDDPRHIDRNASARTGTPQVRLFHAERDRTTILIADFRSSMLWGTRRTLRSIAAAEALTIAGWRAVAEGGRVGLIAVTSDQTTLLAPRPRERAMVRVIGGMVQAHRMALGDPSLRDPPLSDALARAHRIAPRGAEVLIASALDQPGSDFAERMLALNSRVRLQIIRIADAFETDAPEGHYRFATAGNPDGRTGRPAASTDSTALSQAFQIPVRIHNAALSPEAAING